MNKNLSVSSFLVNPNFAAYKTASICILAVIQLPSENLPSNVLNSFLMLSGFQTKVMRDINDTQQAILNLSCDCSWIFSTKWVRTFIQSFFSSITTSLEKLSSLTMLLVAVGNTVFVWNIYLIQNIWLTKYIH